MLKNDKEQSAFPTDGELILEQIARETIACIGQQGRGKDCAREKQGRGKDCAREKQGGTERGGEMTYHGCQQGRHRRKGSSPSW